MPDDIEIGLTAVTSADEQLRLVVLQERSALAEIRSAQAARVRGESLDRKSVVEAVEQAAQVMAARTLANPKNAAELTNAALTGDMPAVLRVLRRLERDRQHRLANDFDKPTGRLCATDDNEDTDDGTQSLRRTNGSSSSDDDLAAPPK